MWQRNNMLLKSIKLPSSYSKTEIDTSVESLDSEEDIVHQIPERWLLNGLKKSLETLRESKV